MATVDLSLEQLLDAIRQLPASERMRLRTAIDRIPPAEEARQRVRNVYGTYRMPSKQRKRMSTLLGKGNAGTLTAGESRELDRLIEGFENRTLAMGEAMARD